MTRTTIRKAACLLAAMAVGVAIAQTKPAEPPKDGEREVTEAQVPRAALDTLKMLANGAAFTAFAEEVEHGHVFYEGSWNGPNGNIDALVTAEGDLVEIEESIPAEKVSVAALAHVRITAGKDVALTFERKTMVLYEAHYKKDGKSHEIVLTPDGRVYHEEAADGADEDQ
jgi:hypothetical protein